MDQLEELYKDIYPKVLSFFHIKTGSQEIAEDLSQETFYQAIRSYASFKGQSKLETWIFAIAKNILKSFYKSKKSRELLNYNFDLIESIGLSIEEDFLLKDQLRELLEAINSLESIMREIVLLRIYGGLTFKEIGQVLDKTENYVRVSFYRIKLKLQEEMRDKNE